GVGQVLAQLLGPRQQLGAEAHHQEDGGVGGIAEGLVGELDAVGVHHALHDTVHDIWHGRHPRVLPMPSDAADLPRWRVEPGTRPDLASWPTDSTEGARSTAKKRVQATCPALWERLHDLQERLYAEARRSLLVVLQAMDAGGKDGTIEHVFRGMNP